ncbi:MAG: hypothetical protein Q9221_003550 [Calogaya cf. arnoldii]
MSSLRPVLPSSPASTPDVDLEAGNHVYLVYCSADADDLFAETSTNPPIREAFRDRLDAIRFCEAKLHIEPAVTVVDIDKYVVRNGLDAIPDSAGEARCVIERRELNEESPHNRNRDYARDYDGEVYLCCRVQSGVANGNTRTPINWSTSFEVLHVCTSRGRAFELKAGLQHVDKGAVEAVDVVDLTCNLW